MNGSVTPEEKLLKLIRGEKKQKPQVAELPKAGEPSIPLSSKPNIKLSGVQLLQKMQAFQQQAQQKYIRAFNFKKAIFVVFILSCAYLIVNLIYPFFGLKGSYIPKIIPENNKEIVVAQSNAIKPLNNYVEVAKNRQLFTSEAALSGGSVQIATVAGPDLMKDLSLVGIIAGDNPQAVIEDRKTSKTYYVNKGQSIEQFKVEDVREGKIVLSHGGQTYELSL
jgi:type II secretory pathway component PulC